MKAIKLILGILFLGCLVMFGRTAVSASQAEPKLDEIISYKLVGSGFSQPTAVTSTGIAGDDRLFVLEKGGRLRILKDGDVNETDFLTVEVSTESERGLLGLVFDPNYAQNGYFYIHYSDARPDTYGDTVIKRFTVSADPDVADADSGYTILEIAQDFNNHDGGWLAFDRDGQLVIGMGDGGSGGDPNNRGQSRDSLLGKMLRINVHESGLPADNGCGRVRNYRIPEDNPRPFGSDGWCAEIWSFGWRNPWRFSFDAQTGDMWAADVGQNAREEVNFEKYGSASLQNYGWRCYEGFALYGPANCEIAASERTDPVVDYGRDEGASVTGGYVYRGSHFPAMQGAYFYGDFATGRLWTLTPDGDRFVNTEIDDTSYNISSFGEGSDDELYMVHYGGLIYQLVSQFGAKVELSGTSLVETDGMIEYRLTVTGLGTDVLTLVQVKNRIPDGVTHVSGGTVADGFVTLDVGDIGPDQSVTVSWMAQASPDAGEVTNSEFSLTGFELPSEVAGEADSGQTTVVVDPPLKMLFLPFMIR